MYEPWPTPPNTWEFHWRTVISPLRPADPARLLPTQKAKIEEKQNFQHTHVLTAGTVNDHLIWPRQCTLWQIYIRDSLAFFFCGVLFYGNDREDWWVFFTFPPFSRRVKNSKTRGLKSQRLWWEVCALRLSPPAIIRTPRLAKWNLVRKTSERDPEGFH